MKRCISIAAMFILCAALAFETAAYSLPLRLHVVANSDSAADQSVKAEVRDEILKLADGVFDKTFTLDGAKEAARENLELFEQCADGVLKKNGLDYTSKAVTGVFSFPERDYGGLIYPAGEYEALRIVLGEGEGQNWWCVMYPSLCATGRRNGRQRTVMKSAVIEWIRRLAGK